MCVCWRILVLISFVDKWFLFLKNVAPSPASFPLDSKNFLLRSDTILLLYFRSFLSAANSPSTSLHSVLGSGSVAWEQAIHAWGLWKKVPSCLRHWSPNVSQTLWHQRGPVASFTLSGVTQTEAFRTLFYVHLIFSEKHNLVLSVCSVLQGDSGFIVKMVKKVGREPGRTVNTAAVCRVIR